MTSLLRKVFLNKRNNQLIINLPRNKFKKLKDKTPSKVRLKIEGWEW
jgi:hypothetical protein